MTNTNAVMTRSISASFVVILGFRICATATWPTGRKNSGKTLVCGRVSHCVRTASPREGSPRKSRGSVDSRLEKEKELLAVRGDVMSEGQIFTASERVDGVGQLGHRKWVGEVRLPELSDRRP